MSGVFVRLDWLTGLKIAIGGAFILWSNSTLAQVTPDTTLGAESSVVTPNVEIRGVMSERVDGGAIRGANLFHSFQEFNVGKGRGVYFTNPQGIENILSRVTGANRSEILGRLGVLGNANLFLINPNGIVFGPNASLNVEGSFVATTAEAIALGEQGDFSATQPQRSSLLSVSPGALFFNQAAAQPGNIIHGGNLSAGKDLTLAANNLDLQGQLSAGEDLTLQANDTVRIRDSVASPFLARSGENLTIVGNQGIDILALNHPTQTPFVSGGNLNLISDGIVSGDARFSSGGSFSIHSASGELANFISFYDPIISSNGDVDVAANYTGASLLVEAKGNIRFQGGIEIVRPDTSALPAGEDTATLSKSTALIMRSGQNTLAYGGVNSGSVPAFASGDVPEGITLGGNVTLRRSNGSGGLVSLTTASGDVSTRGITTNGGRIDINSAGAITTNGETLNARNGANNGGEISLKATNGNINTGNLNSYSYSASSNVANGGTISLKAANGSITTGNLDSSSESGSGNAANGGAIAFTASGNIITGDLNSYSYSVSGNTANGGVIAFTGFGNITTGNLDSSSNSLDSGGNGGMITFSALGNMTTGSMNSEAGGTGNGGDITLISNAGAIDTTIGTITSQIRDNSNGTGRAGTIVFTAKDNIQTALLNASAEKGNGGNIQLTSNNGAIDTTRGNLATDSRSGNGGAIFLSALNNITTGRIISEAGGTGNGGDITLTSNAGAIDTTIGTITSQIRNGSNGTGRAGAIAFTALGDIQTALLNASAEKGNGGNIQLTSNNGAINTTAGDVATNSRNGNGGAIALSAINGSISTFGLNSYSSSNSGNAGQGGAIALSAGDNIDITDKLYSYSRSDSGDAGNGGSIILETRNGKISTSGLNSYSRSDSGGNAGNGGAIILNATNGSISTSELNARSFANSSGNAGDGGFISLNAKDDINIKGDLRSSSISNSGNAGNGGAIALNATNGSISTSGLDSYSSSDFGNAGQGGAIALSAGNNINITDKLYSYSSSDFGNAVSGGAISFTALGNIITGNLNSYSYSVSGNVADGGAISLKATNGSITTGNLDSSSEAGSGNAANGGAIAFTALSNIITGDLKSYSRSDSDNAGNGGTITLNATNGSISTSELNARSFANSSGSAGDGGFISLNAKDNINIKGDLRSSSISNSGTAGNGGAISLEAETGTITTRDLNSSSESSSGNGNRGNGGAITLLAPKDIMIKGSVNSKSSALLGTGGNGGVIRLQASNDIDITGDLISSSFVNTYKTAEATGDAGTINLLAGNNIKIKGDLISDSRGTGFTGNGGTISLKAGNEINIIGKLRSELSSGMSITGNGGKISLFSAKTINIEGSLSSSTSSFMGTSGNGGEINLNAADGIKITGDLDSSSFSLNGTGANGGNITLLASNGSISTGNLDSSSSFIFGIGGNGGKITLEARGSISTGNLDSSSFSTSPSSNGGDIAITSYAGIFSAENRLIRSNAFKNGNGGGIKIDALSVALNNTELTTTTAGTGKAGNIFITADDSVLLDRSRLVTSLEFGGVGKGGDIKVEAETVSLSNNSFIDTATFGQGNAGDVLIKANNSVLLDSNSAIFSITGGEGDAGNVTVNAQETIELAKASNISTAVNSRAKGDGGDITIEARSLSLREGSQLVTTTLSSGKAGTINVKTTENVIISGVDPNFTPTPPRNIKVTNPSSLEEVEPNDSIAQAQPLTEFFLNQPNNIDPNVEFSTRIPYVSISGKGSAVSFSPSQDHYSFEVTRAGTVAIFDLDKPGQDQKIAQSTNTRLRLFDSAGSELTTNSSASPSLGAGGSNDPDPVTRDPYIRYVFNKVGTYIIQVQSTGDRSIDGISEGAYTLQVSLETPNVVTNIDNGVLASGLFARTEGAGVAGNVTINTPMLTIQDGANISATATEGATASARGGSITVNSSQVKLSSNNSGLFALTRGVAPAGSLTLQPYDNGQTLTVNLEDRAQISASTSGSGKGGTLSLTAPEFINIDGNGILAVTAEKNSSGNAGDINFTTQQLILTDKAQISAATSDRGRGGSITVTAPNFVSFGGNSQLSVETTGTGRAGNVTINTDLLSVEKQASISATSTASATTSEQGGSIALNTKQINLFGTVGIFAETQGAVPAGSLSLQPYNKGGTLNVNFAEGAKISASTSGSGQGGSLIVTAPEAVTIKGNGQLAVETSNTGRAGDVTIDTQKLTIQDGAKVSASTSGSGQGGSITVKAPEAVALVNNGQLVVETSGGGSAGNVTIKNTSSLTIQDGAKVSVSTAPTSSGRGGNIDIQSSSLTLKKGEISALTQGRGDAGSINLNVTGLLSATDSNIVTSATQSSGGAIAITAKDIRLYGDSDITTNVGTGTGGGGDITVIANSIIAFDDSDILTFANGGKGGNITLETPAFFGQNYRPAPTDTDPLTLDGNSRVDINARGAVSGVITLPDTSFIQNSLNELSENPIDTGSLIANSCIARNRSQQQGSFTITGSGGLPSRPGEALMSQYTFGTARSVSNTIPSASSPRRRWQKGDPIVEPQGVYRLSSGQLILSRECTE